MAKPIALQEQDWFFERLRDSGVDVQVFLVNGIKLIGRINHVDRYTILLSRGTSSQVIYKHAISTIVPPAGLEMNGLDS